VQSLAELCDPEASRQLQRLAAHPNPVLAAAASAALERVVRHRAIDSPSLSVGGIP